MVKIHQALCYVPVGDEATKENDDKWDKWVQKNLGALKYA